MCRGDACVAPTVSGPQGQTSGRREIVIGCGGAGWTTRMPARVRDRQSDWYLTRPRLTGDSKHDGRPPCPRAA